MISSNVQTWHDLAYPSLDDMDRSIVELGDGDNTVELESQSVCARWRSTIKVYHLSGVKHVDGLTASPTLDIVEALALNHEDFWRSWQTPSMNEVLPASALASNESLFVFPPPGVLGVQSHVLV